MASWNRSFTWIILAPRLPDAQPPLSQLELNERNEALRTNKEFQQALDETALIPTHYPTVYSSGAPDLQKIANQGDVQAGEIAFCKPKPSILPFTTR